MSSNTNAQMNNKAKQRKQSNQRKKAQKKRKEEQERKARAEMYKKKPQMEQRINILIRKFWNNSVLSESELSELKQWGIFLLDEVNYTQGREAFERGQLHEELREIDGVIGAVTKARTDLKSFDAFYTKVDPSHISFNPVWVEKHISLQKERELLAAAAASEVQNVDDLKTDANPPAHAEVAEVEVVPEIVVPDTWDDEVPDEWDADL